MLTRMLKKEFLRKKTIAIAVFLFITLSALLMAGGANMLFELGRSLDALFERSRAPHFVQYHSGELDRTALDEWSRKNELVAIQQTAESINIDESNVYFKQDETPESDGVMEMGFVKQNAAFDFLLDLQSRVIQVAQGEIAVPIYYMQKKELRIGDTVTVRNETIHLTLTIVSFVRDVQMNPSIVSSKRFVVSERDFEALKTHFHTIEYQIGFRLRDRGKIGEFSNAYRLSGLPRKGPAIDYGLLKTLNALTDGLIAALMIFISVLLNVVALLCLRFTILATIEEDYREIGVMKAIGISPSDIRRMHLSKYFALAAGASVAGYLLSLVLHRIFSADMMLYIGSAPKNPAQVIVPLAAAGLIFCIVLLFCAFTLRRFNRITAVEALRLGKTGNSYSSGRFLPLHVNRFLNVNIFLGLRDVLLRFRFYALLLFVFFICAFIIIVPINFLNTIQSPEFVAYMGMARSDIFIDLRHTGNIAERFDEMIAYIANDPDVEKFSPSVACTFHVMNKDGYEERLLVGTGDLTVFPLEYLKGATPVAEDEIALSSLIAGELEKETGETIELLVDGRSRTMRITGIYQDITNGGKTAKAPIPPNHETALWYTVSLDVTTDAAEKIDEYAAAFYPAKVVDLEGYLAQTFDNTIGRLRLLTLLAVVVATLVAILITSLFLKMLIAKDSAQIAIMKSLGFSLQQIRTQYLTRALVVLGAGILLGTICSNTLGQRLLGASLTMIGASKIEFIINPLHAYILSPVVLALIVTITALLSIASVKQIHLADMNAE